MPTAAHWISLDPFLRTLLTIAAELEKTALSDQMLNTIISNVNGAATDAERVAGFEEAAGP